MINKTSSDVVWPDDRATGIIIKFVKQMCPSLLEQDRTQTFSSHTTDLRWLALSLCTNGSQHRTRHFYLSWQAASQPLSLLLLFITILYVWINFPRLGISLALPSVQVAVLGTLNDSFFQTDLSLRLQAKNNLTGGQCLLSAFWECKQNGLGYKVALLKNHLYQDLVLHQKYYSLKIPGLSKVILQVAPYVLWKLARTFCFLMAFIWFSMKS